MKKLSYLLLMLGLITVSCNKTPNAPEVQDVVFQASTNTTGFKASTCDNPIANYALIDIDGEKHQVDVFYLDNKIYTNSIKLKPGEHTIDMFVLVNDGGTPDDPTNDIIVNASPIEGYDFASFVSQPMPLDFKVDAFYKAEVPIELLCYEAAEYEEFGFAWFSVEEIVVREFCFFGDICIDDYMSYAGSLYENQRNGLQHDMPAIFKIDVIRNNDTLITYNNAEWYGEGRPLCVKYPDYSNYSDEYKFVLSILLKDGDVFNYKEVYTWETTDAEALPNIGDDNVMDFVMGDCVPDADLIIPPPDGSNPDPEPTVLDVCFTGDICIDNLYANDYINSDYFGWTALDNTMPALFTVDVIHNGQALASYSNINLTDTEELCFSYTDYPNATDNFEFTLSVLVIDGTNFVYKPFKTWTTTDDEPIPNIGTDNSMYFVIGDCETGDINFPPYTNPNPPADETCSECDGKISALTLEYLGNETNPLIQVTDKDDNLLFNGYLDFSNTFSFVGVDNDNEMTKEIEIFVNGVSTTKIHTSCSVDIFIGSVFGAFRVLDGESSKGGLICTTTEEQPNTTYGSETAFAYGGPDYAICFLDDPDAPDNSRWGWTNGLYSTSSNTNTLELWAGAADCDQTKGTYVGTVTFIYKDGTAKVKYNVIDGFHLDAVHLYVGNEKYPLNGIVSTVAPGKFTFIDDDASDGIDTDIKISGLSGQVYIIAHADVTGYYPKE